MSEQALDDLLRMVFGAFAMWLATRESLRRAWQERDNYKLIAETARTNAAKQEQARS